jgi:hypothetical protein
MRSLRLGSIIESISVRRSITENRATRRSQGEDHQAVGDDSLSSGRTPPSARRATHAAPRREQAARDGEHRWSRLESDRDQVAAKIASRFATRCHVRTCDSASSVVRSVARRWKSPAARDHSQAPKARRSGGRRQGESRETSIP